MTADGTPLITPCEISNVVPGWHLIEVVGDERGYGRRLVRIQVDSGPVRLSLADGLGGTARPRDAQSYPKWVIGAGRLMAAVAGPGDRIDALGALGGGRLELISVDGDDGVARVRLAVDRFDGDAVRWFAPVAGRWSLADGVLIGGGELVAQAMCLAPWMDRPVEVVAGAESDGVFELNIWDSQRARLDGTSATGRVHFGKMESDAETDWAEVSSGGTAGDNRYGFRIPGGARNVVLRLDGRTVHGSVNTDGGGLPMTTVRSAGVALGALYVGFGGGRENRLRIERLTVTGSIDPYDETVNALLGMGEAWWGDGRDVELYYSGGGHIVRLVQNGETLLCEPRMPAWMEMAHTIRHKAVRLRYGDVIGFELAGADEETAVLVLGVDVETGRVVLASHPLTWRGRTGRGSDGWFNADDYAKADGSAFDVNVVRVGSGDRGEVLSSWWKLLGRPFPGMGVTVPAGADAMSAMKTRIR
ncbi:MAG: hypothetical protein HOP29_19125 [Phycisphaerales bacterium]|nr:hypothetical protein [Phycisphaerales bacterium]